MKFLLLLCSFILVGCATTTNSTYYENMPWSQRSDYLAKSNMMDSPDGSQEWPCPSGPNSCDSIHSRWMSSWWKPK
jgi:hypothetical protein